MTRLAIVVLVVALAPSPASADQADAVFEDGAVEVVAELGKRSLRRARRGLTLGPFAGAAPAYGLDGGDFDLQLSFGVGLYRYKIPIVPTPARIKEIVVSRARAAYAERIKAMVTRGETLTDADHERVAREVWEEIKAEFLLELRPRKLEKPGLAVLLEATHLLDAEAWDVRGMVGLGVGPVFVKVGLSAQWRDGAALILPVELSVPVLLTDSLRSPVVDLFARAEWAATGRAEHPDVALLGARFLLDIL